MKKGLKLTLNGEADLQADSSGCIGCDAGVPSSVGRLHESDLQGPRAERPLADGLLERLPVFVPRDNRGGRAVGVALQRHGGVNGSDVGLSVGGDDWRDCGTK